MEREYRRAKTTEIIKYSFGGFASNIPFVLTMTYLMFFYTDIYGIDPIVVGTLMLAARLIDAVTDPMMGIIADRTRSRMGRYRPWIIFSAPALAIIIFLLFSTPNLSPTMKIVYAYTVYILFSIFSTATNIPYHSLTPVISEDPNQRTIVAVSKQAMAVPAQILVAVLALPLVEVFGGGQTGWSLFGALCGVLSMISFWICASGAKRQDTISLVKNSETVPIRQQLKLVTHNRPLIMLMIAFGTDLFASAAATSVNVYYFIYYLNREDLLPIIVGANLLAGLIALLFIPVLAKKFGKKSLYLAATAVCMLPLLALYFLPAASLTAILVLIIVSGMLMYVPSNLGWAMLPDCVEYGEWKLGIRGEGVVSSSITFINKLGMAAGGLFAGLLLGFAGYQAGQAQTAQTIEAIKVMRFIFPIFGYICSLVSMSFYNITSDFYRRITTEIRERKA